MSEKIKQTSVSNTDSKAADNSGQGPSRRAYSAPKVLSSELLEATAVACGASGTLGKNPFPTCQAPSS